LLRINKDKQDYEKAGKIYLQLRKKYESKSQSAYESSFYIGEMESRRKMLWKSSEITDKFISLVYLMAKVTTYYGESASLPLFLWSPLIIIIFGVIRYLSSGSNPNFLEEMIDSLAAFFQFPRDSPPSDIDVIERVVSLPILGLALRSIAIKKRFEIFIKDA